VEDGRKLMYKGISAEGSRPHHPKASPEEPTFTKIRRGQRPKGWVNGTAPPLPFGPRRPFSVEEDAIILAIKHSDPSTSWGDIAKRLPGHNRWDIHRRWLNYLSPEIHIEPWTQESDQLLVEKINEMGQAWTRITPFFEGRSATDLRNRWFEWIRFRTVDNGTKLIYTGRDPSFPLPDHGKCNSPTVHVNEAPRPEPIFPRIRDEPTDAWFSIIASDENNLSPEITLKELWLSPGQDIVEDLSLRWK
jgi:hypothetical protein